MTSPTASTKSPLLYLLIILPAVIMAWVGFQSLRQDRFIAQAEAHDQATALAQKTVDELEAHVAQFEHPPSEASKAASMSPDELIASQDLPSLNHREIVACLINANNDLIWPPSNPRLVNPQPFFINRLPIKIRRIWREAEDYRMANNPLFAEQIYNELRELAEDRRLEALVATRIIDCLISMQEWDEAEDLIQSTREDFRDEFSEFGMPIPLWCDWMEIKLNMERNDPSKVSASQVLKMGIDQIARPDRFTNDRLLMLRDTAEQLDFIEHQSALQKGETITPPTPRQTAFARLWDHWIFQQEARLLHQIYIDRHLASAQMAQAQFPAALEGGKRYLACVTPSQNGNKWIVATRTPAIVIAMKHFFEAMPESRDFSLSLQVLGRHISGDKGQAPLALIRGKGTGIIPDFQVGVVIKDDAAFLERQNARSVSFTVLIALSAVSVLVGCIAIWRSMSHQEKLSRMRSNFVSSVSHELRTPLASVQLMAEELTAIGSSDEERTKEYNQFILQECRRLSGLVENILDFSKIENNTKEYQFQQADLKEVAERTVRLLNAFASENEITLELQFHGEQRLIEADPEAIQQVLVNLIDNAIKHSPRNQKVIVSLTFGDNLSILSVRDHGPGISKDDQSKVFEQFYRCGSELRRETKGVGLGLAIVQHVIQAHKGQVRIESESGNGSEFFVELPNQQSASNTTRFFKS